MRYVLSLSLAIALLAGATPMVPKSRSSAPAIRTRSFTAAIRARRQQAGRLSHRQGPARGRALGDRGQYLTERYIQHNPNAASGRAGVVKFFTEVMKVKPTPIPEKMTTKVVSVTAEGDLVVVAYVREMKDPKDSSKSYTTTWFDMWRFKDGKADEHWDPAARMGS